MASNSYQTCAQVASIIFHVIYLLLSIAVIILAIGQGLGSILPPYDLSIIDLTAILESPFLLISWAIMAGVSTLGLLHCLVGFIAANKLARFRLTTVLMISIIFFLVMFVGLVFVVLYIGKEFPTSIAGTQSAPPMLREKYNMNSADRFTAAFDKYQTQKRCCGIDSRYDFLDGMVPESCCDGPPSDTCETFENGCRSQLTDFVFFEVASLSLGLISLSVLELLLILSSALLLHARLVEDYDNFQNQT